MITYVARNQCGARLCVCVCVSQKIRAGNSIQHSSPPNITVTQFDRVVSAKGDYYSHSECWRVIQATLWLKVMSVAVLLLLSLSYASRDPGTRWWPVVCSCSKGASLFIIASYFPFFCTRMWLRNDVLPWWRWEIIKEHKLLACCLPRRFTQTCGSHEVAYLSLHLYF